MIRIIKQMIPGFMRPWLRRHRQTVEKKLLYFDRVTNWSVLRRVTPYRVEFGQRRGQCIDRYYIEAFIASRRDVIQGRVAEFCDCEYITQFGGDKVVQVDVLDVNEHNYDRTLTVDLSQPDRAPEALFDCIIATQVLLLIRDYRAAIDSLYKMLKVGGVLLVTVPGISPVVTGALVGGVGEDWWRFTGRSAAHDFGAVFGEEQVRVQTYGNVRTATAFLHGLVSQELTAEELVHHDPSYEVVIGIQATKVSVS